MATKKKTKAEQIADISWDELVKLKAKSPEDMKILRGYVNLLRQGYNRRIGEFKRKKVFSYAADAAKKSKIKNIPVTQLVKGMKPDKARNVLISEFAKYQQFFQAETSTIEGINRVNAEQDDRIFSGESTKRSMTDKERETYWRTYEDLMDSSSIRVPAGATSESVQQMLAEAMFENGSSDYEEYTSIIEGTKYDEYGIEMEHLNYARGTKLYNMYKTAYMLKRQERIEQLGRVQNEKPDSPIFVNGRDD